MPELPEVETIRKGLEKNILNRTILDVQVYDGRVIRNQPFKEFKHSCTGKIINQVSRRGKAIIFSFQDPGHLIIQPMMTGQLVILPAEGQKERNKATKITFRLSNDLHLNYNDQRLFGRLQFVRDLQDVEFLKQLGPEPLSCEFDCQFFKSSLRKHKAPIKSLLMNQKFVAGIGNIYASEILFHSKIAPVRRANTLQDSEIERLRRKTIDVLNEAVRCRGTSMLTYRDSFGKKGKFSKQIKVYGRDDQPCVVCSAPILRIVLSGRSTFYCQRCQK